MNSQHIYPGNNRDRHLWTIMLALPDARQDAVARFRNRQDADDHLRVLQGFMPTAKFEIVFNPPEPEPVDLEQQSSRANP